ncbi:PAS domain-containing protein [uncultured Ramlibacter sp.]|uniref:PAS domain-containing protein n=1 Tax=uncultured Ramlibacter sp. TaxID=260755 RepID=UPI0026159913|nr:PAS domain-containing protein [uncultured Ramlibacter sp.]
MATLSPLRPLDFLAGGGEMGALMRIRDWRLSPIGEPRNWPQSLKTAVRLLLSSGHPMFIWWGPRLVQFYNDAYRLSIGPERHPGALGQEGRACWDEIWHIIGPQIEQVMSGRGSTWHENALVPITRNGRREDVYWTYSYSPIDDPLAPTGVGGVLVVCTETTQTVQASRRLALEREQLAQLFEQAPSFMAMLRGPEHRFDLANPAYLQLVGNRQVVGKTVAEVLPEASEQGYVALLDEVYRSGKAYTTTGSKFLLQQGAGGPTVERSLDFVYQPIKDSQGQVTGIFVDGVDVTDRHAA